MWQHMSWWGTGHRSSRPLEWMDNGASIGKAQSLVTLWQVRPSGHWSLCRGSRSTGQRVPVRILNSRKFKLHHFRQRWAADFILDGPVVLGGLHCEDDAGDEEQGAPAQAEPEGIPGIYDVVAQDDKDVVDQDHRRLAGEQVVHNHGPYPLQILPEVFHLTGGEALTHIFNNIPGGGDNLSLGHINVLDGVSDTTLDNGSKCCQIL